MKRERKIVSRNVSSLSREIPGEDWGKRCAEKEEDGEKKPSTVAINFLNSPSYPTLLFSHEGVLLLLSVPHARTYVRGIHSLSHLFRLLSEVREKWFPVKDY